MYSSMNFESVAHVQNFPTRVVASWNSEFGTSVANEIGGGGIFFKSNKINSSVPLQ